MTNLKTAAHNLLTTLKNAAKTPGDIKVSIVPFATDVNVGTGNVNASWIDWTDWDAANGTCSNTSYTTKSSCQSHGKTWTPKPPQHLERLRQRPRPEQRRDEHRDRRRRAGHLFRAHQAAELPGLDDAAERRLDGAQRQDRRHDADRQHQRHHRPGLGLADCSRRSTPFNAPPPAPDLDKVIILLTDGDEHAEPLELDRIRRSTRARRRSATTSRPPTSSSTRCA